MNYVKKTISYNFSTFGSDTFFYSVPLDFNYEKLVTEIGLIIWIGSIFLGLSIYFLYRKLNIKEKSIIVSKKLIFASTLMIVILGLFALIIMFIVSSMP